MRTREQVIDRVQTILYPESDEEAPLLVSVPHPRLKTVHGIDTSFVDPRTQRTWMTPHSYVANDPTDPIFDTLESVSVPGSLMHAALCVFGDSIVEYSNPRYAERGPKKWGPLRYYPAVLMTFLAGFEAWVRISSEFLVATVPSLPSPVADALLERRPVIERSGRIDSQPDRRNPLERFYLLVAYGCNAKLDRGGAAWQGLEKAFSARNALVHYDTKEVPALSTKQLGAHVEATLLGIIAASSTAGRSLFQDQFELYDVLMRLLELAPDFEERPVHKGWPREPSIVYCPYDGVDTTRFPPAMPRVKT